MSLESAQRLRTRFDAALTRFILARYGEGDVISPVVRYALEGPGKRVRPVLCMLAAESLGSASEAALRPALALEMVHTYSLVHDDLPCMDDDDLRRGRPTVHKKFDEALALLAGDALLTDAFAVLAGAGLDLALVTEPARTAALVAELAGAAGGHGMVMGQALDLHWTARSGAGAQDLDAIHVRKTGYLLGAATAMGAITAGATPAVVERYRSFGQLIGLAFQVQDDLLDDSGATGKSAGKDKAAGKLTYLSHMTRSDAERAALGFTHEAIGMLDGLDAATDALVSYAQSLLARTH